ncbi:hypothetical protein AN214_02182 [Pseudoalteromonas sp. P1-9]|uniref:hypothetical protein n=1 Tax=Pseudoalteromonas sp. P1-9 TaxID=1710354 RepID=UPI0006D62577|nr:hypothetical protein [Pseudoalteromonas sp. P1-9]KPV95795.1 hypothetical protein AN214_02182 [Pseudoalteromonas sp. P1-9]
MKLKLLFASIVIALIIALSWFSNLPMSPNTYTKINASKTVHSSVKPAAKIQTIETKTPVSPVNSRLKTTLSSPVKTHVKVDIPPISLTKIETRFTGDLDDHDAYLAYENEQEIALKTAYIQAAKDKVKLLNSWLVKGIEAELEESQLEFAREKIKALEQLSQTLEEELKKAS